MSKIVRMTESDLVRLVKKVIREQEISGDKMKDIVQHSKYEPKVFKDKLEKDSAMGFTTKDYGVKYSIQKTPNGVFRIFVTTPKVTTPTDAEKVFGKNNMFRDYNTSTEAQKLISTLNTHVEKLPNKTSNSKFQGFGGGSSGGAGAGGKW